eukprot:CAMPEP_0203747564 /NCGR_PEP_ID=MMETSP0098-20131031/2675_1 /ASSEMBLY_ACC=CAM_ASM_000208 /TAXON_ID=96639 /ORGANISM=" , Strain NY0313808BC1" /LENGTH=538 /DNA_ID=CAMNT_0050636017 /DNA_START=131 /DNA_END=1743 /DNA_ORIENTATION=-
MNLWNLFLSLGVLAPSIVAVPCEQTYQPGTSYQVNERVSKNSINYRCVVSGWCSQAAYAIGGTYETHAWANEGECDDPNGQTPCDNIPTYQPGNTYTTGQDVVKDGTVYSCLVGGWCSLAVYEMGGPHGTHAWVEVGPCGGSNTTPAPTTPAPTTPPPTTPSPTTPSPTTPAPTTPPPTTPSPTTPSPTTQPPGGTGAYALFKSVLEANQARFNSELFLYQTPSNQWVESDIYRYADMFVAAKIMHEEGVAGSKLFVGDARPNGHVYGLVNFAAFLAQSMKETIKYNVCHENNWDLVGGKYPISNACGQLGQHYQDYSCGAGEEHMMCELDLEMEQNASTHATWYGAPKPLYCGPKTRYPTTGYWDHSAECNRPWASPPETCTEYPGQRAGKEVTTNPGYASVAGRVDVEGCCWWGRGVIQTTGRCNIGKLNYYLGKRAADDGRSSRYPSLDFCRNPNAICDDPNHGDVKWVAGLFYWLNSVQSYEEPGWNYMEELTAFVDDGMSGNSFINAVSNIVNRGCALGVCPAGPLDGGPERA